jgi:hypothetical protein
VTIFRGIASLHEIGDRRSEGDLEESDEEVFHMLQKFASLTTLSFVLPFTSVTTRAAIAHTATTTA